MDSTDVIRAALAGIRERHEGTTPGEWRDDITNEGDLIVWLPSPYENGKPSRIFMGDMEVTDKYDHADAAFIAHAHQDIPTLLALVEAALEALDFYQAGIPRPTKARQALARMADIAGGKEG